MLSGEWGANEELAEDGLFMSGEWTGNSENKVGIDEVCAIYNEGLNLNADRMPLLLYRMKFS